MEQCVSYIYDLRTLIEKNPSFINNFNNIEIINIDVLGSSCGIFNMNRLNLDEYQESMGNIYKTSLIETEGYKIFFENISKQCTPQFLVNCSAGKDRTGIAIVLLMYLLEFDMDTICLFMWITASI